MATQTRDENAWVDNVEEAESCEKYPQQRAARQSKLKKYWLQCVFNTNDLNLADIRSLFGLVCQTLSPYNQKERRAAIMVGNFQPTTRLFLGQILMYSTRRSLLQKLRAEKCSV
jgi:hypothetical protein